MMTRLKGTAFEGMCVDALSERPPFLVLTVRDAVGEGEMIVRDVLDGIQLVYSRLKMRSCYQRVDDEALRFAAINYCVEGSYAWELENGRRGHLRKGEMCVGWQCEQAIVNSMLPLEFYEGITILIDPERAQRALDKAFPAVRIPLERTLRQLCAGRDLFVARPGLAAERVFASLADAKADACRELSLLRVIELMLLLPQSDAEVRLSAIKYPPMTVEAVRCLYHGILRDPLQKTTIPRLSQRYGVCQTTLKGCFKAVYGVPLGEFMRQSRLGAAARLLHERADLSVSDVAALAGYENPGKFSAAFKAFSGLAPKCYRCAIKCGRDGLEQSCDCAE